MIKRFLIKKILFYFSYVVTYYICYTTISFKPIYNVTGIITNGKIFERPLIPTNQILQRVKAYKNKEIFVDILYDVFTDEPKNFSLMVQIKGTYFIADCSV